MNDERDGQGDDNVTPDEFAHLFRPDAGSPSPAPAHPNPSPPNPSSSNPSPDAEADPPLPVSAPSEAASGEAASGEEAPHAPAADEPLEASSAPAPAPDGSRLFRSRGAPERDDAITAVGSLQALRLKTMSRSGEPRQTETSMIRRPTRQRVQMIFCRRRHCPSPQAENRHPPSR